MRKGVTRWQDDTLRSSRAYQIFESTRWNAKECCVEERPCFMFRQQKARLDVKSQLNTRHEQGKWESCRSHIRQLQTNFRWNWSYFALVRKKEIWLPPQSLSRTCSFLSRLLGAQQNSVHLWNGTGQEFRGSTVGGVARQKGQKVLHSCT